MASKGWQVPRGSRAAAYLLKLGGGSPRFWLLLHMVLSIFYPITALWKKNPTKHKWSWLLGVETSSTLGGVAAELHSLPSSVFLLYPVSLHFLLPPSFKRKNEPSPLVQSQVTRPLLQGLGGVGLNLSVTLGLGSLCLGQVLSLLSHFVA